jgi:hypothetical protein
MYDLMVQILWYVVLLNVLIVCIYLLFLVNARINMQRRIEQVRFYHKADEISKQASSSYEAAEKLSMKPETYAEFCRTKNIDTPEMRNERAEKMERDRQTQEKRMLEEEARWRTEQERLAEEHRKAKEDELRERKINLRKSGFR